LAPLKKAAVDIGQDVHGLREKTTFIVYELFLCPESLSLLPLYLVFSPQIVQRYLPGLAVIRAATFPVMSFIP
jgi:hypothetical protein